MAQELKIGKECCIANAGAISSLLLDALRTNRELLVDLNDIERIDTAGLQILMAAGKEAELLGAKLQYSVSGQIIDLMEELGVTTL